MTARAGGMRIALFAAVALALVFLPVAIDPGHVPVVRKAVAFADDDAGRAGGPAGVRGADGRRIASGGLDRARRRYDRAIAGRNDGESVRMFGRALGGVAATLGDAATRALIEQGWKALSETPSETRRPRRGDGGA